MTFVEIEERANSRVTSTSRIDTQHIENQQTSRYPIRISTQTAVAHFSRSFAHTQHNKQNDMTAAATTAAWSLSMKDIPLPKRGVVIKEHIFVGKGHRQWAEWVFRYITPVFTPFLKRPYSRAPDDPLHGSLADATIVPIPRQWFGKLEPQDEVKATTTSTLAAAAAMKTEHRIQTEIVAEATESLSDAVNMYAESCTLYTKQVKTQMQTLSNESTTDEERKNATTTTTRRKLANTTMKETVATCTEYLEEQQQKLTEIENKIHQQRQKYKETMDEITKKQNQARRGIDISSIDLTLSSSAEDQRAAKDTTANDFVLDIVRAHLTTTIANRYNNIVVASTLWEKLKTDYGQLNAVETNELEQKMIAIEITSKETFDEFQTRFETLVTDVEGARDQIMTNREKMLFLRTAISKTHRFKKAMTEIITHDIQDYDTAIAKIRLLESIDRSFSSFSSNRDRDANANAVTSGKFKSRSGSGSRGRERDRAGRDGSGSRSRSRSSSRPRVCFRCNSHDHIIKDCPVEETPKMKKDREDFLARCTKFCKVHGKNASHNTDECKVAINKKKQEERIPGTAAAVTSGSRSKSRSNSDTKDRHVYIDSDEGYDSGASINMVTSLHSNNEYQTQHDDGHVHMIFADTSDEDDDETEVMTVSFHSEPRQETVEYIIDSGASEHITGTQEHMSDMQTHTKPWKLRTAGNQVITVNKTGSMTVNTECKQQIQLKDVTYAPGIRTNLISAGKLIDDGYEILMKGTIMTIQHKVNKTKILITKNSRNLYTITGQKEGSATSTAYALLVPYASAAAAAQGDIWHQRLGHRSVKRIAALRTHESVIGCEELPSAADCARITNQRCYACAVSKATRLPFNGIKTDIAAYILYRVHADLCGPIITYIDINGRRVKRIRYTSVLVDEHSRHANIDYVKTKGEAQAKLIQWIKYIQTRTGKKVVILHSDYGGEYRSGELQQFLRENGTQWTYTDKDTPQNNSIAERIHRTMFESVRSMLTHARLPDGFWTHAMRSATYVYNRMLHSGSSDKSKTPMEVMYNRKPNIRKIRVWGCDCVYWQSETDRRNEHTDTDTRQGTLKLTNTGRPAIFLGYSKQKVGCYIIYDYNHDQIKHVRNVRFHEQSFQFGPRQDRTTQTENDVKYNKETHNKQAHTDDDQGHDHDQDQDQTLTDQPLTIHAEPTMTTTTTTTTSGQDDTHNDDVDDRELPISYAPAPVPEPVPATSTSTSTSEASVKQEHQHQDQDHDQDRKQVSTHDQHQHQHQDQDQDRDHSPTRVRFTVDDDHDQDQDHNDISTLEEQPTPVTRTTAAVPTPVMTTPVTTRTEPTLATTTTTTTGTATAKHTTSILKPVSRAQQPPTRMTTRSTTQAPALYKQPTTAPTVTRQQLPQAQDGKTMETKRTRRETSTPKLDAYADTSMAKHAKSKAYTRTETAMFVGMPTPHAQRDKYRDRAEALHKLLLAVTHVKDTDKTKDPGTYKQAMASSNRVEWKKACDAEFRSLIEHDVFELVELPPGRKAIGCRWVFRSKHDKNGVLERRKARCVAKGYTQEKDIDYQETFAPVMRLDSLRILLALVANWDYELEQMDVTTAFLNGKLEDELYMEQPEGYVKVGEHGRKLVCRLKKSLYGIKQAPNVWNADLNKTLLSLGWKRCKSDTCIYQKTSNTGRPMWMGVFVDDILTAYHITDKKQHDQDKARFMKVYDVKDMGPCEHVLQMRVTRDRKARSIYLDQQVKTNMYAEDQGLLNIKPEYTPLEIRPEHGKKNMNKEGTNTPLTRDELKKYRTICGQISYLSNTTRPDVSYAVKQSQANLHIATQHDMKCVKRTLRYLRSTAERGLLFAPINGTHPKAGDPVTLTVYTDADWGGEIDTGKSTTGYLVAICSSVVSWGSKRQKQVALSSAESEYYAISSGATCAMWVKTLLTEMKVPFDKAQPTAVFTDNQAAIHICEKDVHHDRTKHINIRYHWIRYEIEAKRIQMKYINTDKQPADILTKSLARPSFTKLREFICPTRTITTRAASWHKADTMPDASQ